MIIKKTDIMDINQNNLNESKIKFTDNLIRLIFPLLNEYYIQKKNELLKMKMENQDKQLEVLEKRKKLETCVLTHKRFKKIINIIEQIEKLLEKNTIYLKPTFKREIINILQSITTFEESALKNYSKYVINLKDKMN